MYHKRGVLIDGAYIYINYTTIVKMFHTTFGV